MDMKQLEQDFLEQKSIKLQASNNMDSIIKRYWSTFLEELNQKLKEKNLLLLNYLSIRYRQFDIMTDGFPNGISLNYQLEDDVEKIFYNISIPDDFLDDYPEKTINERDVESYQNKEILVEIINLWAAYTVKSELLTIKNLSNHISVEFGELKKEFLKPTPKQLSFIRSIEKTLGHKFTGETKEEATSYISHNKDLFLLKIKTKN